MASPKILKITDELCLVTGGFTFDEACEHAKALDGSIAMIKDSNEFISISKFLVMKYDCIDEYGGLKGLWIENHETDKFLNWKNNDVYNYCDNKYVEMVWCDSEWTTNLTDNGEKKYSYLLYKEMKMKLQNKVCILKNILDEKNKYICCLKKKINNNKCYPKKNKQKNDDLWYAQYCYACMMYH